MAACNTTAETTAGATCPTGCMDAYTALNTACAPTDAPGGWNETAGGPWSQLMWEVAPTWGDLSDPREDVTVEGYVTWLTLSNHLVDRCPWAGYAGPPPCPPPPVLYSAIFSSWRGTLGTGSSHCGHFWLARPAVCDRAAVQQQQQPQKQQQQQQQQQ